MESKSDAFAAFKKLARRLQNTKNNNIGSIRSDHGGEFQNEKFAKFCEKLGILHNFSAPRTPQQNGVVERKKRSLEELARTMLSESSLPVPSRTWVLTKSRSKSTSGVKVNIRRRLGEETPSASVAKRKRRQGQGVA